MHENWEQVEVSFNLEQHRLRRETLLSLERINESFDSFPLTQEGIYSSIAKNISQSMA